MRSKIWLPATLSAVLVPVITIASSGIAAAELSTPTFSLESILKPPASEDSTRNIIDTRLAVDVTSREATATIHLVPSLCSTGASFEIGDLAIESVRGPWGPLNHRVVGSRLDVGVPPGLLWPSEVTITYQIQPHENFDGLMSSGLTFTWPYYCGNLFPCHSSPDDGLRFELALSGIPAGSTAVYPATISMPSPSYQLAWAIGDFTYANLGNTPAGTEVGVWYRGSDPTDALHGTAQLKDVFAWYEENLGPYLYGTKVASVQADWGPGAYGGMEHHPLWHVASDAMADRLTHAHEAAHGWFGDGIRIACWEDFVLSEGSANYLSARALGAVRGEAYENAVWNYYKQVLDYYQEDPATPKIAWPQSCGTVDVLAELYTSIPYMKGSLFLHAVEQKVGREAFTEALSDFYWLHAGSAAGMRDLLDMIYWSTGYDPTACAAAWLEQEAVPASLVCD
jgi:peptidase M1-like protein